jgi:hypothetical protein
MKIGSSLTKVINIVINQKNAQARAEGQRAVEAHIKKIRSDPAVVAAVRRYKDLEKEIEQVRVELDEKGFLPHGYIDLEAERKIKDALMPPKILVEDVLAQIATSDDKNALKILAHLGIKWM